MSLVRPTPAAPARLARWFLLPILGLALLASAATADPSVRRKALNKHGNHVHVLLDEQGKVVRVRLDDRGHVHRVALDRKGRPVRRAEAEVATSGGAAARIATPTPAP